MVLKKYSKFLDVLERVEKAILVITFSLMVIVMVYQVILRYIFSSANSWSEELTCYLFILNVMLAAAIAIRRNSHLQVDVLINNLKPRVKCVFTIAATLIGIVFLCFLFVYSLSLCSTAAKNISPGLNIPMSIPYSAIPAGVVFMVLDSVEVIFHQADEFRQDNGR